MDNNPSLDKRIEALSKAIEYLDDLENKRKKLLLELKQSKAIEIFIPHIFNQEYRPKVKIIRKNHKSNRYLSSFKQLLLFDVIVTDINGIDYTLPPSLSKYWKD
jgi:hypothetical protein